MNTRYLLALISLVMVATATFAQDSIPARHCSVASDDAALRRIANEWKDAYNAGDHGKVAALYAEDATYLTQHFATGIVHGRANIQAYVKHGTDVHYQVNKIEVLSTTCSGDFAYTIARYESTNAGQKAYGVNLLVMRKTQGKWMIVAHESAVPDPATAIHHLEPVTRP